MADRSVLVRIRGDANDLIRATAAARTAIGGLRKEIDTTNDRTAWMAQSFLALGPALAPLGASAVPVLAGLAAQMTAAGLAGGTMALAFVGIGDTMKAVNEYQLEPTAENFNKMKVALEDFGPAGADFVRFLDSVGPKFDQLQMAAREGMFPGMEEGIREFMDLLPQAERIVGNVAEAIGGLSAEAGKGLAGPEFEEFFDYLETDAAPLLRDMGHTFGNFAQGFADMLVAFGPLSADFSGGFRDMSESFEQWAEGLDESAGFAEFIDYVQESVPKVLDVFESLAGAFLQILEAAAPVGDVMLPALEALFDVIAAIADTPFGTAFIGAAAAMSIYGRAVALATVTTGGLASALFGIDKGFGKTLRGADGAVAKMGAIKQTAGLAAGGIGLMALSMTDIDDKMGVANTAMGTMAGMMVGGPWGAAIGFGIGATMDLAAANNELEDAVMRATQAIESGSTDALRRSQKDLEEQLQASRSNDGLSRFWDEFSGATDDAESSLKDINLALNNTGGIADIMAGTTAGALGLTAQSFEDAAMSADEFRESVGRAFAMLDKRAALREARASIREFTKAFKDAPDDMRKGGAAYDEVEEALDNIARSSLDAAEHLKGMNRVNFLDRMRDQFVAAARQMGLTRVEARHLATELGLLDKKHPKPIVDVDNKPARQGINETNNWLSFLGGRHVKPTVDADNNPARGKVDETNNWLSFLGNRKVTVKIDADASGVFSAAAAANTALGNITDEVVNIFTVKHGEGKAEGGTIGGQRMPYGDKVMAFLAPGEEVISNRYGQADRHRDLLQAINSNRYADGGTVARQASVSASGTRVIERVVERLPRTIVLDAGEMGRVVIDTVDGRIGDHREHDARQSATMWAGVTSD